MTAIKEGYIKFKSQQEINKSRREKTNREFKKLREQVQLILNENHRITQNQLNKTAN